MLISSLCRVIFWVNPIILDDQQAMIMNGLLMLLIDKHLCLHDQPITYHLAFQGFELVRWLDWMTFFKYKLFSLAENNLHGSSGIERYISVQCTLEFWCKCFLIRGCRCMFCSIAKLVILSLWITVDYI